MGTGIWLMVEPPCRRPGVRTVPVRRVGELLEQLVGTEFGPDAVGFPVLNGTGANITALRAVTRPHQGVICTETAHIHVDETASPEAIAGVKLLTVSTEDGKLTPELVSGRMPEALDIPHTAWPSVVSITQATEVGTAYSPAEIKAKANAEREAHQEQRKTVAQEAARQAERYTKAQAERDSSRQEAATAREEAATLRGRLEALETVMARAEKAERGRGKSDKS